VSAFVSDLSNVTQERGIKLLGLLGLEIFMKHDMTIDIKKKAITLTRTHPVTIRCSDIYILRIPFSVTHKKMILNTKIDDRKFKFLFDTGAEIGVLSRLITKRLPAHFRLQQYTKLVTTSAAIGSSQRGKLSELTIGDLMFANLTVIVTNLGKSENNTAQNFRGIIGHDLLRVGIVHINFRDRELTIYPFEKELVVLAEEKKATQ
jgi:hypothetical protein